MNRSALFLPLVALVLSGCASTYSMTLMPRNSGKLYYGEAVEQSSGGPANISVTIEDKTYSGTWVVSTASHSSGYVTGGFGFYGRRGGIGFGGGPVIVDNPSGGEAKALLQSPDGAGLRCDFRGLGSGRSASGTCQDDKGLLYDVQLRPKGSS
jgi:hypothetical protein